MRRSFNQGCNHSAQCQQGLVDIPCFPSPHVNSTRPPNIFTSCQVHQIEFTSLYQILALRCCHLDMHCYCENSVGTAGKIKKVLTRIKKNLTFLIVKIYLPRLCIHQSRCSLPAQVASFQYSVHVILVVDCPFLKT